MGRLTAELPNGSSHFWIGNDPGAIAAFLQEMRERLEVHILPYFESVTLEAESSIEARLREWITGMTLHILTAPMPASLEVQLFRRMFLTYRLLTLEVPPEADHQGKTFADLLPDHNLEFRLSAPDGNFEFEFRVR